MPFVAKGVCPEACLCLPDWAYELITLTVAQRLGRDHRVMSDVLLTHRFYGDLAGWWPLISPVQDYREEAAFAATQLSSASIPVSEVLELGSGGGHSAAHLKAGFAMTLVDISEDMLAVSRELNPECEHHRGDMRTLRLGRTFDAVFIHDAVDYMTTEADLRQAVQTAFAHCRPGGVAVFVPDETKESFQESSDHGGNDGDCGRAVRYLEWSWDPDPRDTWTLTEYVFLLRNVDAPVQIVHETHRLGLFAREDWLGLLAAVGFVPRAVTEVTSEDRPPRQFFVGHRPRVHGIRRDRRRAARRQQRHA